jgi:hypothetical protein
MPTTGTKVARTKAETVIVIEPQGNHFEINPAMAHANKGDTIQWVNQTGGPIDIFFPDSGVFGDKAKAVYHDDNTGHPVTKTVRNVTDPPDNIHYYTVYCDNKNGNSGFARGHSCGGVSIP